MKGTLRRYLFYEVNLMKRLGTMDYNNYVADYLEIKYIK
jgi:hypothetical protein